jgi:cobalt-precorrin 5A hydrolase
MSIPSIAIIAITKQGIAIARKIGQKLDNAQIYVPAKHSDFGSDIMWFKEQTGDVITSLFKKYDALICIFSLGAVIRLIAPLVASKKSDPAVLVIDDKANFVVSALSGHLGGANELARKVSSFLPDSKPVITTAADVNETIAVDLIGRQFGWEIENDQNVTRISALMVNEEKIALYQETGQKDWWLKPQLPKNVTTVTNLEDLKNPQFKGCLIISDKLFGDRDLIEKSVIYRPKSLAIGIGLHWTTSKDSIENAIKCVLERNHLSWKCIETVASVDRGAMVKGLQEFSKYYNIPVSFFDKESLSQVSVPNPSDTVLRYEGTPSVSEASAILASQGKLIVPKQKFPPDLTVAVAQKNY